MALDPISAALDIGGKLIDRLWPNPEQRDAAKLELLRMQQTGELAVMQAEIGLAKSQADINSVEASSTRLFVAGWRPFIGWVCGTAFAWNWIGLPVGVFLSNLFGHPLDISPADLSEMTPVLLGMLGLGAMRSVEKIKGKA